VVVLGLPLLLLAASAQLLPGALWFRELGQLHVLRGIAAAQAELWLVVTATGTPFIALNLCVALSRARVARTRATSAAVVAASLLGATAVASSAARHWQTFLLWRHRQPFGVTDPTSGKDVGYFVFSLPFELQAARVLLALVAAAVVAVALVYLARGELAVKPRRVSAAAQAHFAALGAALLLVVAWRLHLARYALELRQSADGFAGARYADVHVRAPGLTALSVLAALTAPACIFARRQARWMLAALLVALASLATWVPALVQRFAVDPNPLLSEQPFIQRSIAATRGAFGLDGIELHPYAPAGGVRARDISSERLADVQVWDSRVLEARMRDLVTETPYFRPRRATPDTARVGGRRRLTIGSTRELDLRLAGDSARSWANDRLSYTHGLGLPRFSATDIERGGQPRLVDSGLRRGQPRIYFGDFAASAPPWVLVGTRRSEVDLPGASGYHYTGPAGIALSSMLARAVFALGLGSKDLLISHDLTPRSRVLLHRDVHDRLTTLAPFVHWDAHPAAVAVGGRIAYIVDGYTTSASYPNVARVALGAASVSYARAAVRATVDAFTGRTRLYLIDESDPIARAWAAAFPALLGRPEAMPRWLRDRARYPVELFKAQATAYERFHTTRADVFASGSSVWSPPTSLSGSIEVAGEIRFDADDEDDLRRPLRPEYKLAPPPGHTTPRLVLSTSYSPRSGQNLVATLDGWTDDAGRPHLASRTLAANPITLGPAQVSRLVFSMPRVSELLGLRNLELRDLHKSSLDTVSLGRPHLLYLPGGIVQIQSLYKGTSGPGVSRLIGVTAYVNGRAGVGSTIADAVRQALHEPPGVQVLKPHGPAVVGTPVELPFRVRNARRELMTITSPDGRTRVRRSIEAGLGAVSWVPAAPGSVRVHVAVDGMDGSRVSAIMAFRVLSPGPAVEVTVAPRRARVGRRVRFRFKVEHALSEVAEVSTRYGTFTDSYRLRAGTGIVDWTPVTPGPARLLVRVRGRDGQTASDSAKLTVSRARRAAAPRRRPAATPAVTLLDVPQRAIAGRQAQIAFEAAGEAVARITGDDGEARVWLFDHAAGRMAFRWTPPRPGAYRLTISAQRRDGTTAQTTRALTVTART
jgi:uncharacterized membrane protein (UPF0182 family)